MTDTPEHQTTGFATLEDLMDPSWSAEYRRGLMAAWPEIDRLRGVLRAVRDFPIPDGTNGTAWTMSRLAAEGLQGE